MKQFSFILTIAVIVVMASCNNENKDTGSTDSSFSLDSVKAQIEASNVKFGSYFATMDSMGFISCYTSDACINPSNMERICGSQGIIAFFKGAIQMGVHEIKLTTEEVLGGKEAVAEIGKYEILDASGKIIDKGKFIVVWKEENGKWKMHRDEWNSDLPLPAVPAQ